MFDISMILNNGIIVISFLVQADCYLCHLQIFHLDCEFGGDAGEGGGEEPAAAAQPAPEAYEQAGEGHGDEHADENADDRKDAVTSLVLILGS